MIQLARSPRAGVAAVLEHGSGPVALSLIALTTALSALVATRIANEVRVDDLFFGPTREPIVQLAIDQLGPERTAVVIYLAQRSFDALVVATAIAPLFVWLLGSSAVHASARLAGVRRPYRPLLVLFAYATALALIPADLASLALGVGQAPGARIASAIGYVGLGWLGLIVFRGIERHYAADRDRAVRILVVAIVLFYVVPVLLIVLAGVSIIVAALVLGYF